MKVSRSIAAGVLAVATIAIGWVSTQTAAGAPPPLVVDGQTFQVTMDADQDANDTSPGDGLCVNDTDGKCGYLAAVREANADSDTDKIGIEAGTFTVGPKNEPISEPLVVQGAGAGVTIFDQGVHYSMFEDGAVEVSDITLTNAEFSSVRTFGQPVTMRRVEFVDNSGGSSFGGAIHGEGGADILVEDSTFVNNTSDVGGGAVNLIEGSTLTITNSTFVDNPGASGGAAIVASAGTVDQIVATHITVAGTGAGLETSTDGTIAIANSIVATDGPACAGSGITSGGGNVVADDTCGFAAADDQESADPQLGRLDGWGGPTQTVALPSSSPAVDAGTASTLTDDQRGEARPAGSGFDAGAFERQDDDPSDVGVLGDAATNDGGDDTGGTGDDTGDPTDDTEDGTADTAEDRGAVADSSGTAPTAPAATPVRATPRLTG